MYMYTIAYIYINKTTFSVSHSFLYIFLVKIFYINSVMTGILVGSEYTVLSRHSSGSEVITV